MYTLLACISLLACLLAVLPAWQHPHWLIRDVEFARPQVTLLLLACLCLQGFAAAAPDAYPSLWLGGLTLAATGWSVWHLRRYLPPWPVEVARAQEASKASCLSLLTANVEMENSNTEALLQQVRQYDPDLVVTLETNQWWEARLAQLEQDYPHTVKVPLENRYGMHLYSRLTLNDTRVEYLVEEDVPSIHTQVQLAGAQWVQLHLLHPAPPSPTENTESTERDAEIVVVARRLGPLDKPTIVAGDFNDIPWSRTARLFRDISGLLDPRVGRGLFNTFHARIPLLRWPLDHLYHSAHFQLRQLHRLPAIGSDHFPLFTELALVETESSSSQSASTDQHREAEAITRQGEVRPEDVPVPGRH